MQEVSEDPVSLSLGTCFHLFFLPPPLKCSEASSPPSLTQHQSLQVVSRAHRAVVQRGPGPRVREPLRSGDPVWTDAD